MRKTILAILIGIFFVGITSSAYSYVTVYQNMSQVEISNVETKIVPINYWIREPGDFSDLIIIKFDITNHWSEKILLKKDMFRIDVIDPRLQEKTDKKLRYSDLMVDNFFPQYSEDFKLRFQDTPFSHGFEVCNLIAENLKSDKTKTMHVCFDVKRLWNNEILDINGPKEYYLIMNDNQYKTSCPNCKKIKLEYPEPENQLSPNKGYTPPYKQVKMGISPDEVICSSGKTLVIKADYTSSACVFSDNVQKLLARGWHLPNSEN